MAERKNDARVRFTQLAIKTSFIELLKQKPVSKITVTELCEGAGINRATFYAHFTDILDLSESIERDLIENINNRLPANFSVSDEGYLQGILTEVLEHIRANSGVLSVMLSEGSDVGFEDKVVDMLQQRFVSEWTQGHRVSSEDAAYLYLFVAKGSVGLIRKWLDEGMKKSSVEMADIIAKLAYKGFSAFE